jgi:hypothetical protein
LDYLSVPKKSSPEGGLTATEAFEEFEHGQYGKDRKSKTQAEVQQPHRAPVHVVWSSACGVSQVQGVPNLFPELVSGWSDSWGAQGKLVGFTSNVNVLVMQ